MEQLKFYKYATWGLLGLNLLMLSFFFITRGGGPGASTRAIDLLKLNEQQHTQFLASAEKHVLIMTKINLAQRNLLIPYFTQLTTPNIDIVPANILIEIQALEKQKIESTYQHFEEVKNFLSEKQLPGFKLFMNNILKKIIIPEQKSPPPPEGFLN